MPRWLIVVLVPLAVLWLVAVFSFVIVKLF
jgi:hypothetical protein